MKIGDRMAKNEGEGVNGVLGESGENSLERGDDGQKGAATLGDERRMRTMMGRELHLEAIRINFKD